MLRDGRGVSRAKIAHITSIRLLSRVTVDVIEQDFLGAEGFSAVLEIALEFSDFQMNGSHVSSEICNSVESFIADFADAISFVARLEVEAELPSRIEILRTNLAVELASDFFEEGRPAYLVLLDLRSLGEGLAVAPAFAGVCVRSQLAFAGISVSTKVAVNGSWDLVEIVQVEL